MTSLNRWGFALRCSVIGVNSLCSILVLESSSFARGLGQIPPLFCYTILDRVMHQTPYLPQFYNPSTPPTKEKRQLNFKCCKFFPWRGNSPSEPTLSKHQPPHPLSNYHNHLPLYYLQPPTPSSAIAAATTPFHRYNHPTQIPKSRLINTTTPPDPRLNGITFS